VSSNNLSGTLPASFADLSKLVVLRIAGNPGLVGSLPPSFGQLHELQLLDALGTGLHVEGGSRDLPAFITLDRWGGGGEGGAGRSGRAAVHVCGMGRRVFGAVASA
jgi:hypothetical protein